MLEFSHANAPWVCLYIWVSVKDLLSLRLISTAAQLCANLHLWASSASLPMEADMPFEHTMQTNWKKETTVPWNLHTCMLWVNRPAMTHRECSEVQINGTIFKACHHTQLGKSSPSSLRDKLESLLLSQNPGGISSRKGWVSWELHSSYIWIVGGQSLTYLQPPNDGLMTSYILWQCKSVSTIFLWCGMPFCRCDAFIV